MRVVIDTNIMLVILSARSQNRWLFERMLSGELSLCVTSDILSEYAEIVERHIGQAAAELLMSLLEVLPNVLYINRYYRWELITADPDDNKFVDCAIAANADYLITQDKHFLPLKTLDFPKVSVVSIEEFGQLFGRG